MIRKLRLPCLAQKQLSETGFFFNLPVYDIYQFFLANDSVEIDCSL